MSEVPVSRVLSALTSKGFVRRDTHHIMLWYQPPGRRTAIVTRFSHGENNADDWLLARMAHQLRITKRELLRLIECGLDQQGYQSLLIERGHLER